MTVLNPGQLAKALAIIDPLVAHGHHTPFAIKYAMAQLHFDVLDAYNEINTANTGGQAAVSLNGARGTASIGLLRTVSSITITGASGNGAHG